MPPVMPSPEIDDHLQSNHAIFLRTYQKIPNVQSKPFKPIPLRGLRPPKGVALSLRVMGNQLWRMGFNATYSI